MFGIGDNNKLSNDNPVMLDGINQLTEEDSDSDIYATATAVATPAEGFSSSPMPVTPTNNSQATNQTSNASLVQDIQGGASTPTILNQTVDLNAPAPSPSTNSPVTVTPPIVNPVVVSQSGAAAIQNNQQPLKPFTMPAHPTNPAAAMPTDEPTTAPPIEESVDDMVPVVLPIVTPYNPSALESPAQPTTRLSNEQISTSNVVQSTTQTIVNHANQDHLAGMKQQALDHLETIVDHLDQTPEDTFKTTMMMIQANDNHALLDKALEAAKLIKDDKARAQAMLDIVNEINYFSQNSN